MLDAIRNEVLDGRSEVEEGVVIWEKFACLRRAARRSLSEIQEDLHARYGGQYEIYEIEYALDPMHNNWSDYPDGEEDDGA